VSASDRGRRTARLVGGSCALGLALVLGGSLAQAGFGAPVAGPVKVRAFSISGGVSGLYPGADVPLVLTVKDDRSFPITVTSVTTTVRRFAGGCPSSLVSVGTFTGSLRLQPGQAGTVQVTVTMAHRAPRLCEGRSFFFEYHGVADAP
jgi:hypothetical protein